MPSKREPKIIQPEELDHYIRPGDHIVWSQGTAEPLTLTESFVQQRSAFTGSTVFVGITHSTTLRPAHTDHLSFSSYCGLAQNRRLVDADVLNIIPAHCSQLPAFFSSGVIACDVVFLHISRPGPNGKPSLGIGHDYLLAAAQRARVVIAEMNDQMPWTYGSSDLDGVRIDAVVHSSRELLEVAPGTITDTERRIARYATEFIGDGAVLEMGIGGIPDAILASLGDRRDLGIHSGMIGDSAVGLIEAGSVTNALKSVDAGVTVAGVLLGSQRLYDFARQNRGIQVRPANYTHNHKVLASIDGFTAINSAIEVDLTGQVNAECIAGRYVGAVGGQVDFVRGALAAKNGCSMIALPSTAKQGATSRIVPTLGGPVTTLRTDADVFVTEWGAAQLKGQSLNERVRRMIAIAHPAHREALTQQARHLRQ